MTHTNTCNTISKCFRRWCKYLVHANYRLASIFAEFFSTLQGHKLCNRSMCGYFLMSVCVRVQQIDQLSGGFSLNLILWSFTRSYLHILNLVKIVQQRSLYVNTIKCSAHLKRNSTNTHRWEEYPDNKLYITIKHKFYSITLSH